MAQAKRKTRTNMELYAIDFRSHQIVTSKLPSIRDVLSVLFYNTRKVNLPIKQSARLVFCEISVFWQKARIPIIDEENCVRKIENLYEKYRKVQISSNRRSNIGKENDFNRNSNDLFDIAHRDALKVMKIEQDKLFIIISYLLTLIFGLRASKNMYKACFPSIFYRFIIL